MMAPNMLQCCKSEQPPPPRTHTSPVFIEIVCVKFEEERLSLKLWAIMRMRPELEQREHHESNRRYESIFCFWRDIFKRGVLIAICSGSNVWNVRGCASIRVCISVP